MSKFSELVNGNEPVLIDVFADWCAPCKIMIPILKDLKVELGGQIKVIKIDIDKNPKIADKFQIKGVPTLLLFKEGKIIWRQSGIHEKKELIDLIRQKIDN